jgi:hypothetical protein
MVIRDSLHLLLNLHEIEALLQKIESMSQQKKSEKSREDKIKE